MSDPRYDNRAPVIDGTPSNGGWFIAAAAAVIVVVGVLLYGTSGDAPTTAGNPQAQTTGQSDRAPIPANPGGTAPQREAPRTQ
jgi:hypothetical protein